MERPDINSKKYTYFHKKLGKKMFNNQKYLEDCKKFAEQNVVLPQGDVIGSLPEHKCKYCGVMTIQPEEQCYKAPTGNDL